MSRVDLRFWSQFMRRPYEHRFDASSLNKDYTSVGVIKRLNDIVDTLSSDGLGICIPRYIKTLLTVFLVHPVKVTRLRRINAHIGYGFACTINSDLKKYENKILTTKSIQHLWIYLNLP